MIGKAKKRILKKPSIVVKTQKVIVGTQKVIAETTQKVITQIQGFNEKLLQSVDKSVPSSKISAEQKSV